MRKIILFSLFLIIGLIGSQTIPTALNPEAFEKLKSFFDAMLYICLAFIMINVGREFELDKTKWKSYTEDYFIAMATAAVPWLLICGYFIFLMPVVKPFCRAYFCRNPLHDACSCRSQEVLGLPEDKSPGHI